MKFLCVECDKVMDFAERQIPGDGTLAQGRFVDGGGVTHNQVLNTLITATGLRTASGGPIADFGDDSLAGGLLPEMLA